MPRRKPSRTTSPAPCSRSCAERRLAGTQPGPPHEPDTAPHQQPLPAGHRRPACDRGDRGGPAPRLPSGGQSGLRRCRHLLRPLRLPDQPEAARRPAPGAVEPVGFLRAPHAAHPPGPAGGDRRHPGRGQPGAAAAGHDAAGQTCAVGLGLRLQLHPLERVGLLRCRGVPQAAAAPVVAGDRGAVLHRLARRALGHPPAAHRHGAGDRRGPAAVAALQPVAAQGGPHGGVLPPPVPFLGTGGRRPAGGHDRGPEHRPCERSLVAAPRLAHRAGRHRTGAAGRGDGAPDAGAAGSPAAGRWPR